MNRFYQWLKKKGFLTIIISVFVIGILIHGSRIFTSYYFHDDITLTGSGATYISGRWFLQIVHDFEVWLMGFHVNVKGIAGVIVLSLLAVICCIIANGLNLKKQSNKVLLSAVVVTFPFVTTLLSYTFTSVYYCISIIMALLASILLYKNPFGKHKWCSFLISIVLLGLSMGIYQTSICSFIAFSVLLKIKETLDAKDESWKIFICKCIKYLGVCIGGLLFYLICNKIALHLQNIVLTDYQGLNTMTDLSIESMLHRILFAYKEFLFPSTGKAYSLYFTRSIRYCYRFVLLALFIFVIVFIIREIKKKNLKKALQLLLLFLVAPIAINSVFLTADISKTIIYPMMMFSEVMVFICLISAEEYINWDVLKCKFVKAVPIILSLLLIYSSIYFGYVANICYRRVAHQQEQAIGYFNRLITRIQLVEGYQTSLPIAYINELSKNEEAQNYVPIMLNSIYNIVPYNFSSFINLYNWRDYMKIWCGYSPREVSNEEMNRLLKLEGVKNMPSYPNDGSIQIVDNTIVVKFS